MKGLCLILICDLYTFVVQKKNVSCAIMIYKIVTFLLLEELRINFFFAKKMSRTHVEIVPIFFPNFPNPANVTIALQDTAV